MFVSDELLPASNRKAVHPAFRLRLSLHFKLAPNERCDLAPWRWRTSTKYLTISGPTKHEVRDDHTHGEATEGNEGVERSLPVFLTRGKLSQSQNR